MKTPTLDLDASGDEVAMEDLIQQKPEALTALHCRYQPLLRNVALQILHDESDADEVVLEVFSQLWRCPWSYRAAKGRPLGWLVTLSRRRAIDCLRRKSAYRRATERFESALRTADDAPDHDRSVEREVCRRDLRQYLTTLMTQLPPAQQTVVTLGFFGGMSQRQIAAAMNLPLGTVKTRMELGLKKLAAAVAPLRAKIE